MQSVHEFLVENYEKIFSTGECTKEQVRYMIDCLVEMARSDEREFRSRMRVLFMHLLKFQVQDNKQSKSWVRTIREQSRKLQEFTPEKALLNIVDGEIPTIYKNALKDASDETGLPISAFPQAIPMEWSFENLTNSYFIEGFLRSYAKTSDVRKFLHIS